MLYCECVTSLNVAPLVGAPPFNVCVERIPDDKYVVGDSLLGVTTKVPPGSGPPV